jgi:amino acid adenylation domain-containing protein
MPIRSTPRPRSIHGAFEERAAQTPNACAVIAEDRVTTYAELDASANRIADRLSALGVCRDVLVGVLVERSVEMVAAMLAVMKAGAAYVPLDPTYPDEHIAHLLSDSRAPVLLTQERLAARFRARDIVLVDVPFEHRDRKARRPSDTEGEDLAYVIYTSGSTGNPKGVMVPHRAALNYIAWGVERFSLVASDAVLQQIPYSFDPSVYETFLPLVIGARLVLARPDGHRDGNYIATLIRDHGVASASMVPASLRALIESPIARECTTVKAIVSGGEALPPDLVTKFYELWPRARMVNVYGPTETTIGSTHWICRPDADPSAPIPIGLPVANTEIRILDEGLRLVPDGDEGEIYIGGRGLARGYWNMPDLTAASFIPNPFDDRISDRLYRTGDRARRRPDGALEFKGRADEQVKVRGFRVELGEIECAALTIPGVQQIKVMATVESDQKYLVAYVVTPDPTLDKKRFQAELRKKLPEHMIPVAMERMTTLPLLPNGKVDVKALPRLRLESSSRVEPRTRLEERLVELWKRVMDKRELGIEDDFFALGGDSLRAARIVNQLYQDMGEACHVAALFEAPTIRQLAELLRRRYAAAVARVWGEAGDGASPVEEVVDDDMIARMRSLLRSTSRRTAATRTYARNPRAIFLIQPPRQGSTLMRVVLQGNGKLFAPPELFLLAYDSMRQRREDLSGAFSGFKDGTVRALMQLLGCEVDSAREIELQQEEEDLSTHQAYARLQALLGDRILVDKSMGYELDLDVLRRAEQEFDQPLYIHCARHPCGAIHSFVEARLDQIFYRLKKHPFSARQLAELNWVIGHENILSFLDEVPERRWHRVRYEDLVAQPESTIRALCAFLSIDFDAAMLDINADKKKRMTDVLSPEARPAGDWKFGQYSGFELRRADAWRGSIRVEDLSEATRRVATRLGYADVLPPKAEVPAAKASPSTGTPLTFGQERLWRVYKDSPQDPVLNATRSILVRGRLDVGRMREAIDRVVDRHAILKSVFRMVDGKLAQIPAQASPALAHESLGPVASARIDSAVRERAQDAYRQPIDIERGPIFHPLLLELGPDQYALLLKAHHIAVDGYSWSILFKELGAIYRALTGDQSTSLAPAPQLSDYAQWQRAWLTGEVWRSQVDFWRSYLAGSPDSMALPVDRPYVEPKPGPDAKMYSEIPEALTRRIRVRARDLGVTAFIFSLVAFQKLLSELCGGERVTVGVPVTLRNRPHTDQMLGYFVNHLALWAGFEPDEPFEHAVARMRGPLFKAFENLELPVREALEISSFAKFYQVRFNFLEQSPAALDIPSIETTQIEVDGTVGFDLSLYCLDQRSTFMLMLRYKTSVFDPPRVRAILDRYVEILDRFS